MTTTDIRINTFDPGEFDSWLTITVGDRELDVKYDHDKPRRTEILEDGNEIDFPDEERDAIMEMVELFFTFYDADALKAEKMRLTEEAVGAMEQHLAQNAAGQ